MSLEEEFNRLALRGQRTVAMGYEGQEVVSRSWELSRRRRTVATKQEEVLRSSTSPEPSGPQAGYAWRWASGDDDSDIKDVTVAFGLTFEGSSHITQITLDWGDGTVETYYPSGVGDAGQNIFDDVQHTYSAFGSYSVEETALDANGLSDSVTGTVTIPHHPYDEYVFVTH